METNNTPSAPAKAAHTPGPWKATILDSYGRFEIAPVDGGRCIAKPGSGWGDAKFAEEQEANARLIAAAPELLEALAEMVEMIESGEEHGRGSPWHLQARAAIDKART